MYVILVYDICKDGNGQKRWNRVFKLCKQNLVHIQKSVFEGEISEADLFKLEKSIDKEIDKSYDSVIIFKSRNERWLDKNVMGLCLTYKINLGLSLRKTAQALNDIHGISISHQQVANYCKTAAICIKPFTDNYDYRSGKVFTADETYIKVKGIRGYIWFIMDAVKRSIIGYRISSERDVGACILAMRMAFKHFKKLPEGFRFVADGYSAYVLAAQQFLRELGDDFKFDITRVIGLTNDDAVSAKFRPYKQMIERLNRTYKASYRTTNGFSNIDGANYDLALWVTYYNFLRPHKFNHYKVLNEIEDLKYISNMPGKWQMLIALGQQTILELQSGKAAHCS